MDSVIFKLQTDHFTDHRLVGDIHLKLKVTFYINLFKTKFDRLEGTLKDCQELVLTESLEWTQEAQECGLEDQEAYIIRRSN